MDPNILMPAVEEILEKHGLIPAGRVRKRLAQVVAERDFDLQDEAFIEKIVEDKEKELLTSFTESLGAAGTQRGITDYGTFLTTDEGVELVVEIIMANVDYLIDFYYTVLIGAHLSDS